MTSILLFDKIPKNNLRFRRKSLLTRVLVNTPSALRIKTASGGIYVFSEPDSKGYRKVRREGNSFTSHGRTDLTFSVARIMGGPDDRSNMVKLGENLYFYREGRGRENPSWETTPIVSIEEVESYEVQTV